jgi:hypothetical protein
MALIGYYGHGVALSVHLRQWAAIASSPPPSPSLALTQITVLSFPERRSGSLLDYRRTKNKELRVSVSPLDATLTKNRGWACYG